MSHLDDLPHCIRRNLEQARTSDADAGDDNGQSTDREPASGSGMPRDEDRPGRASSCSRSRSRVRRRARLRPNPASGNAPAGPPPPVPIHGASSAPAARSSDSDLSQGSFDSSEIIRQEDLRRRGGTPVWAKGSTSLRRSVLARDRTAPSQPMPADDPADEAEEGEEEEESDPDPFATDTGCDEREQQEDAEEEEEGDFHTTGELGEVSSGELSPASWPTPDSDDGDFGFGLQTKD